MRFNTPILFLIFNREDTTRQVFEKIREIKPSQLFIAADGPRNEKEYKKCNKTRAVVSDIDWDCEVKTLFRDQNLGCGKAVSEGITWFFDHVEQGIILEDDCLPDLSFFSFCESLLDYYKDEKKVWHISGDNFQNGIQRGNASYYFSMYNHIWGWASWRDRWENYSLDISKYNVENDILKYTKDYNVVNYFKRKQIQVFTGEVNTWDFQWLFCMIKHNGLAILPNSNLVTNIGFGKDSTNTKAQNGFGNHRTKPIYNINFLNRIELNTEADQYTFRTFVKPHLIKRAINLIKSKI